MRPGLHIALVLLLAACGRIGYVVSPEGGARDAAVSIDAAAVDASPDLAITADLPGEPPDLAPPDATLLADLAVDAARSPDATPAHDLATVDHASPDLATSDLATPDLAQPDLGVPDLAQPDLALPDLAAPDLIPGVMVFSSTGATQTFVVPEGATVLDVKLWGGAGGSQGDVAGAGGFLHATAVPVTPGESLTVIVAGGGVTHAGDNPGGFGGGGDGSNQPIYAWAGSGGGRSAILRDASELVTAGGGGGTGYGGATSPGGDGCALPDGSGGDGLGGSASGRGGTLTAGGAGGIATINGHPGTMFHGGNGLLITEGPLATSGGGGGGWFGGGGGAHTINVVSAPGGGGSCHSMSGQGTVTTSTAVNNSGDPDDDGVAGRPVVPVTMGMDGNPGRVVIHW